MEKTSVARWESRGGHYYVEIFRDAMGYTYSGRGCGGVIAATGDSDAIEQIAARLQDFQADATKTPMRRRS